MRGRDLRATAAAVSQSGITARTVSRRILAMQTETRNIQEYRLPLDTFLDKVEKVGRRSSEKNSTTTTAGSSKCRAGQG